MPSSNREEWPQWARDHFPDTPHQAVGFEAIEWHYALHMQVLVVAHTRIEGTWIAYCHPVPGMSHADEHENVLNSGDRVNEDVARAMFGHLDFLPYNR